MIDAPGDERVTLLCTVRNCRAPLTRDARRLICTNRHSFDIARTGYANLLQPQDRRARNPGDTAAAVAARRRFLDRGHTAGIDDAIVRALPLRDGAAILDAGCGEGHSLAAFRRAYGAEAHGVDISVLAIDLAARRHPDCACIVANADRFLPYADGSFQAVVSITARMNPGEFHRVLAADATLLVAIPGADDLIEVREAILGERIERDRSERTIETFAPLFRLERHDRVRHVAMLDRASITDVMSSSYRALRSRQRERLEQLQAMNVTLSRDILLFSPLR